MKSHFKKNKKTYQESIKAAISWYISVLNQCIDIKSIKENRLKLACQSKKTAYDGIVSIWNKNDFNKEEQDKVVKALETAWLELVKVVKHNYPLAGMSVDQLIDMGEDELSDYMSDEGEFMGLESDVARSVGEAKKFAENLLHDISNAIDNIEADEKVLEEKSQDNVNQLNKMRLE